MYLHGLQLRGIKPNMIIILVLFIGLFAGQTTGGLLGMIFGVFVDFFVGRKIGVSGILLGTIGFAGGYLDKNFSKDSKITIILMCIGATCFYNLVDYFFISILYQTEIEILALLKIIGIEATYNAILIIILYPLIQKMGYRIEDIFKGSNVLTRYF